MSMTAPTKPNQVTMTHTDCDGMTRTLTIEVNDYIKSYINAFKAFLHMANFHPNTINKLFTEDDIYK